MTLSGMSGAQSKDDVNLRVPLWLHFWFLLSIFLSIFAVILANRDTSFSESNASDDSGLFLKL